MTEQKEYIVTLKDKKDLDEFYYDMETPGGNLYIPNRSVDLLNRRPISRNTHYNLTDAEANQLRQDPRVLAVESIPDPEETSIQPDWTDTSSGWYKGFNESNTYKNWGLLRCFEGVHRTNWGADGTSSVTGTVNTGSVNGTNVDVLIVDGLFDPNHPEFAVNSDGSGGSRVVQYNWTGYQGSNYNYGTYTGGNNAHGCHTAGTAAGNTQGWARNATIYNISPFGAETTFWDHVRVWHNAKTNGRPTVSNNSWSWSSSFYVDTVASVYYRGQTYNGPFTSASIQQYGVVCGSSGLIYRLPYQHAGTDADFVDAINDGIICVASAGNSNFRLSTSGHPSGDYNNYITRTNGAIYYYNRAPSPATHAICVGATSLYAREERAEFSNSGPRVDIWAPGYEIQSSRHADYSWGGGDPDPRNNNYYLEKISGTSMSGPQVTGVIAAFLQDNPTWSQTDALNFLIANASYDQLYDNGLLEGVDNYSLFGAPNRFLKWPGNNVADTTPPTIQSKSPTNNEQNVSINTTLSVTFSEAMNPSSINSSTFVLSLNNNVINGSYSYSNNTAVFTPSNNLNSSTTYTAAVGYLVEDLAGNNMEQGEVWTFTTGTEVVDPPPANDNEYKYPPFAIGVRASAGMVYPRKSVIYS